MRVVGLVINREWSGNEIKVESAREVIELLRNEGLITNVQVLKSVYAALNELLLNILHHAYPYVSDGGEYPWKIEVLQKEQGFVSVSIEDCGISIPASVLKKINDIADANDYSDSSLILKAIDPLIRNRQEDEGRGQGLKSILSYVDRGSIVSFCITSRNGTFEYASTGIIDSGFTDTNFKGTRVEFTISEAQV
ncbi:sensor histidine kinase [Vibrio vulnificus]|nr:sensor histidine kinase [Vibrio vulnificus]